MISCVARSGRWPVKLLCRRHAFGLAGAVSRANRISAYVPEERFVGENQFASILRPLANSASRRRGRCYGAPGLCCLLADIIAGRDDVCAALGRSWDASRFLQGQGGLLSAARLAPCATRAARVAPRTAVVLARRRRRQRSRSPAARERSPRAAAAAAALS